MSDEDRRELYWSMLRGIAKVAQDRLCAADEAHDWSPWHCTALRHDEGFQGVLTGDRLHAAMNEVVRTRSDRHCYNCGKTQMS